MNVKGWQKALIIILPYFIVVGLFQFIGAAVVGVSILEMESMTSTQEVIVKAFDFLGAYLLIFFFVRYVFKDSIIDLGFRTGGFSKQFVAATFLVFITIIGMFGLLVAIDEVSIRTINFNYYEFLKSSLLFLFVALVEELLFRGYIQHYLMQSMNKYLALVITSLVFTAVHLMNPNTTWMGIMSIFVCGFVMGLTYIHTKSLWFPIVFHFWWNFIQVHLGFNVSGKEVYSIIELAPYEANLLNGGAFGFEGSVFSLVAQALVLVGFYFCFTKSNGFKASKSGN